MSQAAAVPTPAPSLFFCPIFRKNVNQLGCQQASSVPQTNLKRCSQQFSCACPHRLCRACVIQGRGMGANTVASTDAGRTQGLCQFHLEKGEDARFQDQPVVRPQPRPFGEVVVSIKGRKDGAPAKPVPLPASVPDEHYVAEHAEGKLRNIPTSKISPLPGQPRRFFDRRKLKELEDSIRQDGQKEPAIVVSQHDGTYRIRDGERRWRVCTKIGVELWCMVVPALSYDEELKEATIANLHREGHTPFEKALMMQRLRDGELKMSLAELARTFGVSIATVDNHLKLLDLPAEVLAYMDPSQQQEEAGLLQMTVALLLTAFKDHPAEQISIAKTVVEKKLSLGEANRLVDKRAKDLGIRTGRGRQKTGYDHLSNLKTALRSLHVRTEPFQEMGEEDFEALFAFSPAEVYREFKALAEARHEEMGRLLERLQKVRNPGCRRFGDAPSKAKTKTKP